ncbi:MAG: hypothetical protein FWD14_07080, partial [Treponema sp.]|nr:hypothetical protein [Treponema sp.]
MKKYLQPPPDICIVVLLIALTLIVALSACSGNQNTQNDNIMFTSFRDIPGVTEEHIKAIYELREKYGFFTYGVLAATEAFYNDNGVIRGFTALFCEWLTEIFEIEFIPTLYEWGDLFPNMKPDFSGE